MARDSRMKEILKNYTLNNILVLIEKNEYLIVSLKDHTHVVGHNSMALVLSNICGLQTINISKNLPHHSQIPQKYIDYYL